MSRKIQFYCADCQEQGPIVGATPVGAAFGTEKNARAWFDFLEHHLDMEHDIAISENRSE